MSTWRHPLFRSQPGITADEAKSMGKLLAKGFRIGFSESVTPEQQTRFLEEFERANCPHKEYVCVEASLTGEVVAKLCYWCDTQLPADWSVEDVLQGRSLSYANYKLLRNYREMLEDSHRRICDVCADRTQPVGVSNTLGFDNTPRSLDA